jgi:hypothetical protein
MNVVAMMPSGRTGPCSRVIARSSSFTRRCVLPLPALAEMRWMGPGSPRVVAGYQAAWSLASSRRFSGTHLRSFEIMLDIA